MLKTLSTIGMLACLLSLPSMGRAQALPTATGMGRQLQAGGGFSYARPDYGDSAIMGASLYADYNLGHLGVEAGIHRISFVTPTNLAENSYFIGPRILFPHGRFTFYCKALFGMGDLVATNPQNSPGIQNNGSTLFAYSLGGGIEYQATQRIVVRALDYERQRWSYIHGLTPAVITVGIAYRFY